MFKSSNEVREETTVCFKNKIKEQVKIKGQAIAENIEHTSRLGKYYLRVAFTECNSFGTFYKIRDTHESCEFVVIDMDMDTQDAVSEELISQLQEAGYKVTDSSGYSNGFYNTYLIIDWKK